MSVRTVTKCNARTCVKHNMYHIRKFWKFYHAQLVWIDHVDFEFGKAVVGVVLNETHGPHSKHPLPVVWGARYLWTVDRELRGEHRLQYAWEFDPKIQEVEPRECAMNKSTTYNKGQPAYAPVSSQSISSSG